MEDIHILWWKINVNNTRVSWVILMYLKHWTDDSLDPKGRWRNTLQISNISKYECSTKHSLTNFLYFYVISLKGMWCIHGELYMMINLFYNTTSLFGVACCIKVFKILENNLTVSSFLMFTFLLMRCEKFKQHNKVTSIADNGSLKSYSPCKSFSIS